MKMINKAKELIDNRLGEIVSNYPELKEAMEYALFPGGKRFRPLLLLMILLDLNRDIELGLDIACAIEMIHTYSLIHDDLPAMDNDDMRRGKPSMHVFFGENIAILTGDALLTESFYWISSANLTDEIKIKLVKIISELVGARGMIKGQLLDIKADDVTFEEIDAIHKHKTVDLIRSAVKAATIIAGVKDENWNELANYLGRAFQIKDDLKDIDKSEEATIIRAIGSEKSQEIFCEHRTKCLALIDQLLGKKNTYTLV